MNRQLLRMHGSRDLMLELAYNSRLVDAGPLGPGWSHGFEAWLEEVSADTVKVHTDQKRQNTFKLPAGGTTYLGDERAVAFDTVTRGGDGTWTLLRRDRSGMSFAANGSLAALSDRNGRRLELARDGGGRVAAVTEPVSARALSFSYNAAGKLGHVTASDGRKAIFGYDASNRMTSLRLESADGTESETTTYEYDVSDRLVAATGTDGNQIFRDTYDSLGRVTDQQDGTSPAITVGGVTIPAKTAKVTRFLYDETTLPGFIITTVTDRLGGTIVHKHDTNLQLVAETDQMGNTTSYEYDDQGNRTAVTDARGNRTGFTYTNGHVTRIDHPDGTFETFVRDASGNATSHADEAGNVSSASYDANNNRLTFVQPGTDAPTQRWEYDVNGLPTKRTRPSGLFETVVYQAGRPVQTSSPDGTTVAFGFNAAGRLASLTDGEGGQWTFAHDLKGRLTRLRNPENEVSESAYDSFGNLLWQRDPRGAETTCSYDGNGNLVAIRDAAGGVTLRTYDAEDRLLSETDPSGRTTSFEYYPNGWLKSVAKAGGAETQILTYDAAGNPTEAFGTVVARFEYDARNRRTASIDAYGRRSEADLDARGLPESVTDALGRSTGYTHAPRGLLKRVDAAGSVSTVLDYDLDGELTSVTRPGGAITAVERDVPGRSVTTRSARGRETTIIHDRRKLPVSLAEPAGDTTAIEYDAAGRPERRTDGTGVTTYGQNAAGQLETVVHAGKTIRRTYDLLGRVTSYEDGEGNTLGYDYDPAGRLTKLTYPDGKTVTYGYDSAGRLQTITDWLSRVTTCQYDSRGKLSVVTRPNQTRARLLHDANGKFIYLREESTAGATICEERLRWDAGGQLTARSLDPLPAFPEPWTFKATFNADDAPATVQGETPNTDIDGNLRSAPFPGGTAALTYDCRNRLTGAAGVTYQYDAEDRRTRMTTAAGTTRYVVDPNAPLSRVLVSTAPDGTVTRYVYGPGLLYEDRGGQIRCYHYDHLGSTLALSDSNGNVVGRVAYSEYGQITSVTGQPDTPFLFHGRYGVMTDPNGLVHMRARFYHPWLGRFLTEDPAPAVLTRPLSLNRYAFVEGRPTSLMDPTGYAPQPDEEFRRMIGGYARGYADNNQNAIADVIARGGGVSPPENQINDRFRNLIPDQIEEWLDSVIPGGGKNPAVPIGSGARPITGGAIVTLPRKPCKDSDADTSAGDASEGHNQDLIDIALGIIGTGSDASEVIKAIRGLKGTPGGLVGMPVPGTTVDFDSPLFPVKPPGFGERTDY